MFGLTGKHNNKKKFTKLNLTRRTSGISQQTQKQKVSSSKVTIKNPTKLNEQKQ